MDNEDTIAGILERYGNLYWDDDKDSFRLALNVILPNNANTDEILIRLCLIHDRVSDLIRELSEAESMRLKAMTIDP